MVYTCNVNLVAEHYKLVIDGVPMKHEPCPPPAQKNVFCLLNPLLLLPLLFLLSIFLFRLNIEDFQFLFVLLSKHVQRFSVSRSQDFCITIKICVFFLFFKASLLTLYPTSCTPSFLAWDKFQDCSGAFVLAGYRLDQG